MVLFERAAGWALGALLISSGAFAEGAHSPDRSGDAQRIPRIAGAGVRVDGRLDEPAWRAALEVQLDFESKPGDGTRPPVATRAFLVYDDHHLYIAFDAADPEPGKIRAHLMDRDRQDTFEQDDYVAVTLDTYNDSRRAFEFRVNPRGVQMDGLYSSQIGGSDFTWDVIWDSAGRISETGYQVEIALPFDQLRFLGRAGEQVWGVGLARSWPRDVLHLAAAHRVDRNNTCDLCQLPRYSGLEGIAPGHNLELTPTLTFDHTRSAPTPGAELGEANGEAEAGLSLRWGFTPSLTVGATYNPDFSQVEADALQLAVNQRFALFYPEKRSFFLEGGDFFETQITAISTRTVVDPVWGLKLTGKPTEKTGVGFFVAEDETNDITLPSSDGSDDSLYVRGKARTIVGRFRRDVGRSSAIGVVYTRREGEGGYLNQVGGVDAYFRLADRHLIQVQALTSDTTDPSEVGQPHKDPRSGKALEAQYQYQSRDWSGFAGWRSYDEDFRVDSGFVPRVDFETWRGALGRTFWSDDPQAFFNRIKFDLVWLNTRDQAGLLTDSKWDFIATFAMPKQSSFSFESIYRDERQGNILFEHLLSNNLAFEIQPSEALHLSAKVTLGDAIDYRIPRQADERVVWLSAEIKPGFHWNTKIALADQELSIEAGRLFENRLADLQVTCQLNTRSFVRATVQYNDIDYEAARYRAPPKDFESLASQLLFSYKINPQTLLFLGYSDGYLGIDQGKLEDQRRTFFVKLSYAFTR